MADVANLAGVSLTTVGRVIHHNGYVSAENRRRVEEAVQRLGYVPNTLAQGLKSGVRVIGHILRFNPNMLFAQISRAVDQACTQAGYRVLSFTKYGLPKEDERIVTEFIGRRMQGVIITSTGDFDKALVKRLTRAGIPVVWVERAPEKADRVLLDDRQGVYSAMEALLRAGHTKVGYIGLPGTSAVERRRLEGYRDALRDKGIGFSERLEALIGDYTPENGYRAMESLWQRERPTAVFAAADTLLSGAMQYLYKVGVRVPEDISLIGYDNTVAALLSPPADSVGIHAEEMGRKAVELLLRRREEPEGEPTTLWVGTELVERGTVQRPREG